MARGRFISKTLGTSRKFSELPKHAGKLTEFAQLLFPLLVANTDDFGRLPGDAFTIKHRIFPTSARRVDEFAAAIRFLHSSGLILHYTINSNEYIQIVNFDEHQSGLHKRSKSYFPEKSGISRSTGTGSRNRK